VISCFEVNESLVDVLARDSYINCTKGTSIDCLQSHSCSSSVNGGSVPRCILDKNSSDIAVLWSGVGSRFV
jgi:hypothetical protein